MKAPYRGPLNAHRRRSILRALQSTFVISDSIIGRSVEIRSTGGIVYRGIVRSVRADAQRGELFELSSARIAGYRRLVYVTDRRAQISDLERAAEPS
jgi:hypothetical protein